MNRLTVSLYTLDKVQPAHCERTGGSLSSAVNLTINSQDVDRRRPAWTGERLVIFSLFSPVTCSDQAPQVVVVSVG